MPEFESHGLTEGVWSGILTAGELPARVALVLHGRVLAEARLAEDGAGVWRLAVELPRAAICEGAHSLLLIADGGQGLDAPLPGAQRLGRLDLMAGAPLEGDLVAEIALLRAELDLLKREFRRLATDG